MINQNGQIFILAVVVLSLVMLNTLVIISNSLNLSRSSKYTLQEVQAINLAEAGIDKAIATLNSASSTYTGENETALGVGTYEVVVTTKDAATKLIQSTGYIPNKANNKVKKSVKIETTKGVGVSFIYGIQVGEGGLALGNNNLVMGSIYSNGSVTASNNNEITGDVWVAGGPQGSPDQQNDCSNGNCADFIFGKSVNGDNRLDVAMSFKPQSTGTINKVSLKLKKYGTPPDISVRLLGDSNNKPDKNNVITTGTLSSSLVTTSYSFIDVAFNSSPILNADTTYWIMLDTSSNNSNYWSWQNDLAQSYTRGFPMWSPTWNTGNPSWNTFNGDLAFKTIMGGVITKVDGGSHFEVGGSVHANTIEEAEIEKDAYYQTISGSTVGGVSYPGSEDPPPKVFPISDANINEWKNQAQTNGVSNGDISTCQTTLNSKKYVGNITFDSNCTSTVKSPLWITGNLTLNNGNILKLDSTYGSTSGIIIVEGQVNLGNGNKLQGTGTGSSILMVLSDYDSRANGISAIKVNNTGNSGVFYADKGIIEPGNSNDFKELTAWQIKLANNVTINYETGLSSSLFTSGPSGSYTLVKRSYQSD